MFATLAVLTGALVLLYQEHRGTRAPLMFFVPVPWLLFTLRQNENYLWGPQVTVALCAFFAVASFTLLKDCDASRPRLAGAVACAIGASLTFSNGLLVWPIGCLQLIVQRKRGRYFAALAWGLAAAVTTAIYLKGYQKPAHHPSIFAFVSTPAVAAKYFFASLGSAFAVNVQQGIADGVQTGDHQRPGRSEHWSCSA
jgi:hypothetical protein